MKLTEKGNVRVPGKVGAADDNEDSNSDEESAIGSPGLASGVAGKKGKLGAAATAKNSKNSKNSKKATAAGAKKKK